MANALGVCVPSSIGVLGGDVSRNGVYWGEEHPSREATMSD